MSDQKEESLSVEDLERDEDSDPEAENPAESSEDREESESEESEGFNIFSRRKTNTSSIER